MKKNIYIDNLNCNCHYKVGTVRDNQLELTWHLRNTRNSQQSKKFAAIRSSRAISGAIGNSGISVELLVYRTLYVKYMQTFCSTCDLKAQISNYLR